MTIGLAIRILAFAPLQIATIEGYFKQEGVAPKIVLLHGGSAAAAALASLSIQFVASAAPDVILSHVHGLDYLAVANILGANDQELVISSKLQKSLGLSRSMPLRQRLAPIQNKIFGITSFGSPSQVDLLALLRSVGLTAAKPHFIAVGGSAQANAGIEAGTIAGYLVGPPTGEVAQQKGYGYILVPVGSAPAFANQAFTDVYTTGGYAKAHPGTVRRVATAIARADTFLVSHPQQAARALSPQYGGTPLQALAAGIRAEPFVRGGTFTQKSWENAIAALRAGGVIKGKAPSAASGVLWTNAFVTGSGGA